MQRDLQEVWHQIKKIRTLYEDDSLIAVYKPSGVLMHQSMGLTEPTLAGWVKKTTTKKESYPIYRLDRGTSGVVLFAKNKNCAHILNTSQPRKNYILATRGVVPQRGFIDHPVLNRKGDAKVSAQTYFLSSQRNPTPKQKMFVGDGAPRDRSTPSDTQAFQTPVIPALG